MQERLRRRPEDGAAWLALARLLALRPPGPELYHAIEQAIRSLPESADAWLLAAAVHHRQRGAAAALQWLEQSAQQNPALAAPRTAIALLRGDAYRRSGRWREALAAYREVEPARSSDPLLLNNIGNCLASLEQYAEAGRYFERALQQQPDFAEARLNVGFLRACQGRDDEALKRIDAVLQDAGLDPGTRRAAQTLRDILTEHRRLAPPLAEALVSGEVGGLQDALARTPARLSAAHEETVATLRALAGKCRDLAGEAPVPRYAAGTGPLPLLEAFTQCNAEGGAAALARLCADPADATDASAETADPSRHRRFQGMRGVIRERAGADPRVLQEPEGEAWLKYWHARLLADEPGKRPGQYKISANAIKDLPLTPPERVAGTYRKLLAEILPEVPGGFVRGLFLYVAANMIHGFGDGNGRLARFFLAWETEAAGTGSLLVPVDMRAEFARGLDAAWLERDLAPLVASLVRAHSRTDALLKELQDLGPLRPVRNAAR